MSDKEKLNNAFNEAWRRYNQRDSGYKPGLLTSFRHRQVSGDKIRLKQNFDEAFKSNDPEKMEDLLFNRLSNGTFNNGSFNTLLVNALQEKGINKIKSVDVNDFKPRSKRIIKEEQSTLLYRFDARSAEEIASDGGFKAQQHSALYDEKLKLKSGGVGVSFSTDKNVAIAYMAKHIKAGKKGGALYTVKLNQEEANRTLSLSKTAKTRGMSDLELTLRGGAVTVTNESGIQKKQAKEEVNVVPEKEGIAVSFESIQKIESTEQLLKEKPFLFKTALKNSSITSQSKTTLKNEINEVYTSMDKDTESALSKKSVDNLEENNANDSFKPK
jgi:hypothetical protein